MLTEKEIARNLRAMDHAIAQQTLEGLTVPQAALDDLRRVAYGEITTSDALRNAHARFAHVEILHP